MTSSPLLLPAYFILYFLVAFLVPAVRVARRIGKNPVVIPRDESPYGIVGRYFRLTLLGMLAYVLAQGFVPAGHAYLLPLPGLEAAWIRGVGWGLLLGSLAWTSLAQWQMRDAWRVGIDAETPTELVSTGLFSLSRNPIFLGMTLSLGGLGDGPHRLGSSDAQDDGAEPVPRPHPFPAHTRGQHSSDLVYRPRRPTATPLYPAAQHHLESFLAEPEEAHPLGFGVASWVERDFRAYLRRGILAHGFQPERAAATAARSDWCRSPARPEGHARRVTRAAWPRFAAHVTDHVLTYLPVRQWVLSLPKRLRPLLHHDAEVASAVLRILIRALRTTLCRASPGQPRDARLGAVSFPQRFGSSVDASVRIEGDDRAGLERLLRYCARPPLALERLHAPAGLASLENPEARLLYRLPEPDLQGRTVLVLTPLDLLARLSRLLPPPRIHRQRYHGVLAPNARLRARVVAIGREAGDDEKGQDVEGDPEPLDAAPGGTMAIEGAGPFAPPAAPAPPRPAACIIRHEVRALPPHGWISPNRDARFA